MYDATCSVLENIEKDGSTYSQRGDARVVLKMIQSFEFIFILHLMKEIMGITDILCQSLQPKSQDILNAMHLVLSTKILIQKLREEGWNRLLENVLSFCEKHDLNAPDLSSQFCEGRSRHQQSQIRIEHHYHFDIFNEVIDFQLQELNSKFNVQAMDLLTLSIALDLREIITLLILIEDGFLEDNLVVNIEREIAETFSSNSILEDFVMLKEWRSQF
ncbi:hypothetical protein IHE45_14G045100 [Dioscorea alata]|uniref:Uncharacterized protein n=1 Tax=Dioscorea alata TaxID=55571 RepID=A0ACB7URG9_DIOAL|nr:hypothetical protein IHE45_14G045100 [Dioscorea alata]